MIRVLLADDHPLMRAGIRSTLSNEDDVELVGEAVDAFEARRLALEQRPDVLLLDLSMPGPRPSDTVKFLRRQCPQTRVLALTAYDDDAYVSSLVAVGVAGYVLKDESPDAILRAVRTVAQGSEWFSSSIQERINRQQMASAHGGASGVHLTGRESEVLALVVKGHTDREVAEVLGVAERTVRYHLRSVYDKLGVSTRAEACARAAQVGLVPPEEVP